MLDFRQSPWLGLLWYSSKDKDYIRLLGLQDGSVGKGPCQVAIIPRNPCKGGKKTWLHKVVLWPLRVVCPRATSSTLINNEKIKIIFQSNEVLHVIS